MLDFTKGDFANRLIWTSVTLIVVGDSDVEERETAARAIEESSAAPAIESMRRIDAEMAWAAAVLVEAGFVEPAGRAAVPDEPLARLSWNLAYRDAAASWIAGDPDWQRIGGAARCALDLLDAGVAIQVAARGVGDGSMPVTSAVALHNYSVVFGAMRVHLREWLDGRPQKLAAQRARAAKLKAADWYASVEESVRDGLVAGHKVESIVADVLAQLKADVAYESDLPTPDAVRVKIQRIKRSGLI